MGDNDNAQNTKNENMSKNAYSDEVKAINEPTNDENVQKSDNKDVPFNNVDNKNAQNVEEIPKSTNDKTIQNEDTKSDNVIDSKVQETPRPIINIDDDGFSNAVRLKLPNDEKPPEDRLMKSLRKLLSKSTLYSQILQKKMDDQQLATIREEKKSNQSKKSQPKPKLPIIIRKTDRNNAGFSVVNERRKQQEKDRQSELSSRKRKYSFDGSGNLRLRSSRRRKVMSSDEEEENNQSERRDKNDDDFYSPPENESESESESDPKNIYPDQPRLVTGAELRDFQKAGLRWLLTLDSNGFSGILADEMGLGKTLQTISFIAKLIEDGNKGPFLIVCPLSVLRNWIREFNKFTPKLQPIMYHGTHESRVEIRKELKARGFFNPNSKAKKAQIPKIICTTYEMIVKDSRYFRRADWRYIVVDEGHRLKNVNTRLIKELKTFSSTNRLILTGTPLQNNLAELWSLLNFCLPQLFDDLDSFQRLFNFKSGKDNNADTDGTDGPKNETVKLVSTLHEILRPFLLRRLKADVAQTLPPKKEYVLYAPLTQKQKDVYDAILNRKIRDAIISIKERENENKRAENSNNNTVSQQNATEHNSSESENKGSEEKPIKENPIEGKPTEEKPTEEKPTEEKPTEEKPTEEKPTEEKPTEEKPIENLTNPNSVDLQQKEPKDMQNEKQNSTKDNEIIEISSDDANDDDKSFEAFRHPPSNVQQPSMSKESPKGSHYNPLIGNYNPLLNNTNPLVRNENRQINHYNPLLRDTNSLMNNNSSYNNDNNTLTHSNKTFVRNIHQSVGKPPQAYTYNQLLPIGNNLQRHPDSVGNYYQLLNNGQLINPNFIPIASANRTIIDNMNQPPKTDYNPLNNNINPLVSSNVVLSQSNHHPTINNNNASTGAYKPLNNNNFNISSKQDQVNLIARNYIQSLFRGYNLSNGKSKKEDTYTSKSKSQLTEGIKRSGRLKKKQEEEASYSISDIEREENMDDEEFEEMLRLEAEKKKKKEEADRKRKERNLTARDEAMKSASNMRFENFVMQARKICAHPYIFHWDIDPETNDKVIDKKLVNASGKMMLTIRLLEELIKTGHKTLIFSQFKVMLDIFEDYFVDGVGWPICRLDGATSQMERDEQIDKFNNDDLNDENSPKIFLLSTRAGGLGINLTGADSIIFYDSDWNPQMDIQAQDRVHRIGQTKPVLIFRLITENTIEQKIMDSAKSKRKLESMIISKDQFKGNINKSNNDIATIEKGYNKLLDELDISDVRIATNDEKIISDHELKQLLDRSDEAMKRQTGWVPSGDDQQTSSVAKVMGITQGSGMRMDTTQDPENNEENENDIEENDDDINLDDIQEDNNIDDDEVKHLNDPIDDDDDQN